MIRIHIDPKLHSLWAVCVECFLAFRTLGLHRAAPYWGEVAIKRAELRSPSRPHRRLS